MKIKRGTHRTVFVGKYLTVKFPRVISLWRMVRYFFTERWEVIKIEAWQRAQVFIEGFRENNNEFLCWKENKANFLVPVYFSIGLVEIQKTVNIQEITEKEVVSMWKNIVNVVGSEVWKTDSHSFASKNNYFKEGNQFKLVDYGGRNMREFIREYRKELEVIFSSNK